MKKPTFKKLNLQHFAMKNMDEVNQEKTKILERIVEAQKNDDMEAMAKAWNDLSELNQRAVREEFEGVIQASDSNILNGRGVRQLTSEEKKYYEKVIEAMKSSNPKQALTDLDNVLPVTTINAVFDDLVKEHPLLDLINFQNTSGLIEFIVNTNGKELAVWGTLTATISKELTSGFKKVNMTLNKLSAFLPVAKSMLDLGPAWLDRYVRSILAEALAFGLEEAIIDGTGKNMPIGMNRQVGEGVTVVDGVYPLKTTVPVKSLEPASYGALLSGMAEDANGNPRKIESVVMIVNPADYLSKVMPVTTVQTADKTYVNDVFPFPTKVIQSVQVPSNKAIIGLANRYFMGVGTAKSGKIEYSDDYKFLEDERTYLVKLYGHGEPLDNNAFVYIDITDLEPAHPVVRVTDYIDARLEDLALTDELGEDVAISFDKNNHGIYSVAIEDSAANGDNDTASLVVTGDDTATIVVKNGDDVVAEADGAYALTLTAGDNVITITSTIDGVTEAYVMVIDYTEIPAA